MCHTTLCMCMYIVCSSKSSFSKGKYLPQAGVRVIPLILQRLDGIVGIVRVIGHSRANVEKWED